MATYYVTCINKQPRHNPHEGITHLGGLDSQRGKWYDTRAAVVHAIENNGHEFYTLVNNQTTPIGVVREAGKDPYLRTYANGYYNDNLLSLNECPV